MDNKNIAKEAALAAYLIEEGKKKGLKEHVKTIIGIMIL